MNNTQMIIKEKDNRINTIINNAINYAGNIKAYQKYTTLIAYLIKALSLPNNAISSSIILSELLKRGIFSKDGSFVYSNGDISELDGFLGLNVVNGLGNYKHVSRFESDVLGKNYLMSRPLYCGVTTDIIADCDVVLPDYAINVISHDNTLYGYDVYRGILLSFDEYLNLHKTFNNGKEAFYYTPITDSSIDDTIPLLSYYNKFKNDKMITASEYKEICYWAKRALACNESLFNDFKDSSKKYVREITKNLK